MPLKVRDVDGLRQLVKTTVDELGQHIPHHKIEDLPLPPGAASEVTLAAVLDAINLLAKVTDMQPVDIQNGLQTFEAALQTIQVYIGNINDTVVRRTDTLKVSIVPREDALLVAQDADITDIAAHELVPATVYKKIRVISLTVSNGHSAQGTWVNLLSGAGVIYSVYAAALSSKVYPIGEEANCDTEVNEALSMKCETAANVRVAVACELIIAA